MTKSAPLESARLMMAAMHARDDLRGVFIPVIDQALKDAAPEHIGSLNRLRDLAHFHADSLRFALKDRKCQRLRVANEGHCTGR
jgi:hypothetical protein